MQSKGNITMSIREKLIELLAPTSLDFEEAVYLTDYLVKNGVTVQEFGHWVSLTDCANAGVYCSVCHKKVYKEDYAWCNRKNKLRSNYCPHCGAKMLPHPPKGE
jgi:hypothetical protein